LKNGWGIIYFRSATSLLHTSRSRILKIIMRHFLIMIILCVILGSQYAWTQGVLHPDWVLKYSSTVTNGDAEAWDVAVDRRGHLYWTTSQFRPGFLNYFDVMVYKLDTAGNELWSAPTIYGAVNNQQAYVCKLGNNHLYVAGRDCRADEGDVFVLAVDTTSGDTLWSTRWDQTTGYDEADGILIGSEGIYVTGWTTGDSTRQDVALLKLDSNGIVQWSSPWGGVWGDHADGHSVIDDSVIYVAGLYGGAGLFNNFDGLSLLAKFARTDGSFIDSVTFGRTDPWLNMENALGMSSDGTFLYVVGVTTVTQDDWDIFLAKYDKNLNRVWHTTWGTDGEELARAIAIGDDGNIYVAGNTKGVGVGGIEIILLKFAPDNSFITYRTWGDTLDDQALNIAIDSNDLYVTGVSRSFHPSARKEAILLKINLDSLNTGIQQDSTQTPQSILGQIRPNPSRGNAVIYFYNAQFSHVRLKVFDASGRQIASLIDRQLPAGKHSVVLNTQNLPAGIYFCCLQTDQLVQQGKIVLIK